MWKENKCNNKYTFRYNVVPTTSSPSVPHNFPASSENCNRDSNVVNMLIARLTDKGDVKIDYQYQLHSDDIEQLNTEKPEDILKFASTNVRKEVDWKKQCEQLTQLLEKSKSECERLRDAMKKREELFNKIIRKSYKSTINLKQHLKKLREENQTYDKLKVLLRGVFNEDQIKALTNPGMNCREWSDQTVKRAIRLRLTCGSVGYQQLLDQNIPLPSERTLRRKMNIIDFSEDIDLIRLGKAVKFLTE